MLCSVLLREGFVRIGGIEEEMRAWLAAFDLSSVEALRGRRSRRDHADPTAAEREQYLAILGGGWPPGAPSGTGTR